MRTLALLLAGIVVFSMAACTPIYRNHGYIPPDDELQEIVVGIDTRSTVEDLVGTPTAGGVREGGSFFYVRSRIKTFGAFRPKEIDRQVLAISFEPSGVVSNIERFGLEDGRVVALQRRVTETGVSEINILNQLFGNLGRITPGGSGFGS